ncbi:MAG: GNAT family N-acetyltransferase, partial [Halocynthiibacter sp.]
MIRTATPQDAKAIAAIWNPFIRDTLATFNSVELSIEDVRAKIDATTRDGFAFLVSETDEIDGFA